MKNFSGKSVRQVGSAGCHVQFALDLPNDAAQPFDFGGCFMHYWPCRIGIKPRAARINLAVDEPQSIYNVSHL
jgi:hypothetical protein